MVDDSKFLDLKTNLIERKLIIGDVKETLEKEHIKQCDFLLIDSDHSYKFGIWYCKNILKYLKKNTIIWVHDWPGYESNGAVRNNLAIKNSKDFEILAIKKFFININYGKPIINLNDYLRETKQEYKSKKNSGISNSQILIKTI